MSKINIKELAHQLQLSVSTVSKALRDSHEISEETKKKVLEMATRLNYVPNPYASSLRRKKSKTIAVVLPEVAWMNGKMTCCNAIRTRMPLPKKNQKKNTAIMKRLHVIP